MACLRVQRKTTRKNVLVLNEFAEHLPLGELGRRVVTLTVRRRGDFLRIQGLGTSSWDAKSAIKNQTTMLVGPVGPF